MFKMEDSLISILFVGGFLIFVALIALISKSKPKYAKRKKNNNK